MTEWSVSPDKDADSTEWRLPVRPLLERLFDRAEKDCDIPEWSVPDIELSVQGRLRLLALFDLLRDPTGKSSELTERRVVCRPRGLFLHAGEPVPIGKSSELTDRRVDWRLRGSFRIPDDTSFPLRSRAGDKAENDCDIAEWSVPPDKDPCSSEERT
jgi:hypothetical protein